MSTSKFLRLLPKRKLRNKFIEGIKKGYKILRKSFLLLTILFRLEIISQTESTSITTTNFIYPRVYKKHLQCNTRIIGVLAI